ncbi:UNVERIFIED_ORG: hypothetical protein J2Y78_004861 [Buttiauxella agrestis ATCC 33320]
MGFSGRNNTGKFIGEILYRTIGQGKRLFRMGVPEVNLYLRMEVRNTYSSRIMALANVYEESRMH